LKDLTHDIDGRPDKVNFDVRPDAAAVLVDAQLRRRIGE
jgi:hypothetical protein